MYGKSTLFAQNVVNFRCENIVNKCEFLLAYENIIHTFSFCGSRKENICIWKYKNLDLYKDKLRNVRLKKRVRCGLGNL